MREPNLRDDLLTKALPFCENLWNVSIRNEPREFSKFHCGGVRIVFICIHALVISNTDVKGKFILFLLWWFSFLDFWRIFVEFEDKFFIEDCRIFFFLVLIEFDEFYSKSWQQWWKVYSNFIRGKENNFLFQFQTVRNWFWNTFFPFFDWNLT